MSPIPARPASSPGLLISIFCLALAAGCSSSEEFRRGQSELDEGRYDEAVVTLREAVEQDREDTRTQATLAEAEVKAAEQHVAAAEELVKQRRLSDAKVRLQTALVQMAAHPKAISMLAEIEPQIERGDELAAQGAGEIEAGRYEQGVGLVDQALAIDASNAQAREARARAVAAAPPGSLPPEPPASIAQAPASPPGATEPREPARSSRPRRGEQPVEAASTVSRARRSAQPEPAGELWQAPHTPVHGPEPVVAARPTTDPTRPLPEAGGVVGVVSRDDDRYPKQMETVDGIIVKLKDTGSKPREADIEIRVGRYAKRYKHLRTGSRATGRGLSRLPWQIVILAIDDATETVRFAVEPLPQRAPAPPPNPGEQGAAP